MSRPMGNWVEYKLTQASVVKVKCVGVPAVSLPPTALTLEAALQALERAGQVRVKILNHGCERVGDTSTYQVELAKVCAMALDPGPSATHMDATWERVAHHVCMAQLCGLGVPGVSGVCQLVHYLRYLPRGRELQPHYPCVHLKQNAKLDPFQVVRLTPIGGLGVASLGG